MASDLTIGIPVFNEEDRIEQAIRSAALQCTTLIVADNASTDNTGAVCTRLAREFPNIRYVRHDVNMGARKNVEFIMRMVETTYMMLLGSHDYIDDGYTEKVLDALEQDGSYVAATGGLRFEYEDHGEDANSFNRWTGGSQHDAYSRVRSLLFDRAPLGWCAYAIFRTATFRQCFTSDLPSYGIDIIFLTRVLAQGKLAVVGNTRYHAWLRGEDTHRSEYLKRITANRHSTGASRSMRNDFRTAQYRALAGYFPHAGFAQRSALRYQAMTRFGMFRLPGPDILYFLLFLPVKLARKVARLGRRIRTDN